MYELTSVLAISAASLAGLTIAAFATLKGWRGWLDLKRLEMDRDRRDEDRPAASNGSRIEIADLKERVRKLEAIAAGIEI